MSIHFSPENDNKLCEVNANTCERRSTECKQLNGTTFCDCKPGFVPLAYGLDYCDGKAIELLTHLSLASLLWDIGKHNSPR